MALPVTVIPTAVRAVRSLLTLRKRLDTLGSRTAREAHLPLSLPALPPLDVRVAGDRGRMEADFKAVPSFRAALDARGLLPHFDAYAETPDPHPERVRLFMALWYEIKGAPALPDLDVTPEAGLDAFLIATTNLPRPDMATRVVEVAASALDDVLGPRAALALHRPKSRSLVELVLREFGEEDGGPETFLRGLLTNLAAVLPDEELTLPVHSPLALLFGALNWTRGNAGADAASRIVAHPDFPAVLRMWLTTEGEHPVFQALTALAANLGADYDPAQRDTLPEPLVPIWSALSEVLVDVAGRVGSGRPLADPGALRAVSDAVLAGLSFDPTPLLARAADGRTVLSSAVAGALDAGGDVGAFVRFAVSAAQASPDVEAALSDLRATLTNVGTGAALSDLSPEVAGRMAALETELIDVVTRAPGALGGGRGEALAALGAALSAAPTLLSQRATPDDIARLLSTVLGQALEDAPAHVDLAARFAAKLGRSPDRALKTSLAALSGSPAVWRAMGAAGIADTAVETLASAFADHPDLEPTPALAALTRQGRALIGLAAAGTGARAAVAGSLRAGLALALPAALARLGRGVDGPGASALAAHLFEPLIGRPPADLPSPDDIAAAAATALAPALRASS
ncbi:MAG: hypothetical protein AAGA32_06940 [Pseudomonadota bacterium]